MTRQYMNKVYFARAIRDKWLENLAKNVISLAKELPRTRERIGLSWNV